MTVNAAARAETAVPWEIAVVVPAQNEERRIASALEAIARSLRLQEKRGGVVVFINNSTDATYERAVAALAQAAVPHVVIDALQPADGGAGHARLAAFEIGLCRVSPEGVLLTTDADTEVDRDWVGANARLLQKADVVFGRIDLDQSEYMRLPADLRDRISVEAEYRQLAAHLASALDPRPGLPHLHGFSGGANMGCRSSAYVEIGGLPPVASGEDIALAERAFAHDLRLARCTSVAVTTSCRLHGRAAGGMAATFARWAGDPATGCEETFEHPSKVYLRAWARAQLRACWQARAGAAKIFRLLGLFADEEEFYGQSRFGEACRWVESYSPALRRSSMGYRELEDALPELRRLTAMATSGGTRPISSGVPA